MKIVIGNDHAGVDLKLKIVEFLRKKGHEVTNIGTDTLDSVDYPDIAKEVAQKVLDEEAKYGILILKELRGKKTSVSLCKQTIYLSISTS